MTATIRISNIKLSIDKAEINGLKDRVSKLLRVDPAKLISFRVAKKSIDARDKTNVFYVLSAEFEMEKPSAALERALLYKHAEEVEKNIYQNEHRLVSIAGELVSAKDGSRINYDEKQRIIVIGCGPAGLFGALILAESGLRPIVIERGKDIDGRGEDIQAFLNGKGLNPESNVLFGEGGAGMFSDGKLTTNTKDKRNQKVLDELCLAGADEEIKYLSKPHIGTDRLVNALRCLRGKIQSLGGEFMFNTRFCEINYENGAISDIVAETDGKTTVIPTKHLLLAIGHSARDTLRMLHSKGIKMEQKPFSAGVRIEHRREMINRSQYGDFADKLPAADYKLNVTTESGRGVYTFCMCPGGYVIPSVTEDGTLCINGMSNHARDAENSNSAVLVTINPEDYRKKPEDMNNPLAGMEFQMEMEKRAYELGGGNGFAPVCLLSDYINKTATKSLGSINPSVKPGYTFADISLCFDDFINDALRFALPKLGKKLPGFDAADAVLTAAETRSSSPVRILRNSDYQSSVSGIFPVGEGSGYAGGIMSSAVDGIRGAEEIIKSLSQ